MITLQQFKSNVKILLQMIIGLICAAIFMFCLYVITLTF